MQSLQLVEINVEGAPVAKVAVLSDIAKQACADTASLYQQFGFVRPWIGYLAVIDGSVVGTCAFTAFPAAGRVEIAYFTFPSFEGRGLATAMARELIAVARTAKQGVEIFAQTLPVRNASNTILQKLGFALAGEVNHAEEGMVWEWRLVPESSKHRS